MAAACWLRAAGGVAEAAPPVALRVVSLGPAITDQVCLLGMASNLVGVTSFCRLPPGMAPLPQVGEVTGVNAEQVVRLKPDVVLATGMTHPRDTTKLEQLGLRVVRFNYAKDFSDICAQFLQLGELLGRSPEAAAIVADARGRLAVLAGQLTARPRPTVFVEVGTRPLFTANKDSFIDDMVVRAGGVNIASDNASGFFSREQVLAQNPEAIVIVTMGVAADAERETWMQARGLRAAAGGRIYVMDAYTVCSPTPTRFAEATEEMARLLHPGIVGRP